MTAPPRQLLVYDGDCGFCGYCIDYARARTGEAVDYQPYQSLSPGFSELPEQAYRDSIQLFEDGERCCEGAEAAFRVMRTGGAPAWLWLYRSIPGFALVTEWLYRVVARHRPFCLWLAKLLIGSRWLPLEYTRVAALFLRGLALVYLVAFASFAVQAQGLIGSQGILPIADYLDAAGEQLGASAYRYLPTLLWFSASDLAINGLCVAGIIASVALWMGWWPRLCTVLLFVFYLSLVHAGQVFMRFQWDVLLLESGFLAIVLSQWRHLGIWLYRWLLLRFMFLSGAVKLLSGDPTWWQLQALDYHFETQPLPTPLAWYADQLPGLVLKAMTAGVFFIELVLPLFILGTRQMRLMAAGGFVLLQTAIILTGNYNFFNLLTILLCLPLLDDRMLPQWLQPSSAGPVRARSGALNRIAATSLLTFVMTVSLVQMWQVFYRPVDSPTVREVLGSVDALHLVNTYGLFANMTTERYEITIEGSTDGERWKRFPFRYKPGLPADAPPWVAPHQPRLEWQMWFAALSSFDRQYWLQQLLIRLGTGSEPVTGLFAADPFPDASPTYMRARVYRYRFTDSGTRERTGRWWNRELIGRYSPVIRLSLKPEKLSL